MFNRSVFVLACWVRLIFGLHLKEAEPGNALISSLKGDLSANDRNRLEPRQSVGTGEIAFHIYLQGDTCFSDHEIIKFDQVGLNVGGGSYKALEGIYTIPTSGIYVFSFTIMAPTHNIIIADLIVDGVVRGTIMSDSEHSTDYHPGTATTVVNANAGDHVYLRMQRGSCWVASRSGYARSALSGWKLS